MFPFIDSSTTMLPNGALCGSHYKTGRREGRLGTGGLAMQRRLGHVLCLPCPPRSHGRGRSGLLDEDAWEEPLL